MRDASLSCLDNPRREAVRAHHLHGLDYAEVEEDHLTLQVVFLGKAPQRIKREHLRILGGDRIRDLQVVDVRVTRSPYPDRNDSMKVKVDRTGDLSTYVLEVVEAENGSPTDRPRPDFDPRHSSAEVRFRPDCASDLDCVQEDVCTPVQHPEPSIDYLAKDYASFRQLMLDRLALIMPDWRERHVADLEIALVEVLAYIGDHLSYYQDAVATEAYLETARRRISVRRHARLVDYSMHEGCSARAWVVVQTDQDFLIRPREVSFITGVPGLPKNQVITWADVEQFPSAPFEVFEPMDRRGRQLCLRSAHNTIRFYTWGDVECCLVTGATSATFVDDGLTGRRVEAAPPDDKKRKKTSEQDLADPAEQEQQKAPDNGTQGEDRQLNLRPGDVLIFEEVIGPRTGNPADADPSHRQAVRLTSVKAIVDPLDDQPLVSVEWAPEDALTFPLCLSAIMEPDCEVIRDISVARGNVILVDHGRRQPRQPLGDVCVASMTHGCEGPGLPGDVIVEPTAFQPVLDRSPLTFAQALPEEGPAARLLDQDPRSAIPQVWIFSRSFGPPTRPEETCPPDEPPERRCLPLPDEWRWIPRADLIDSTADDLAFVVEIDNERLAHIRFGDGDLGRRPEARSRFCVGFRLGNGLAGNVGPEAIAHMVARDLVEGPQLLVRNPMPAIGGQDPEPMSEVKLFAPTAYRRDVRRAVVADDYARLAQSVDGVQRAAATLRWTGSWYEAFVAIDPMGTEELDDRFRRGIDRTLRRYRRIGQDLEVAAATYVPLFIQLSVCAEPDAIRGHVQEALIELFSNRVLPSGRRGFFHADNMTFGRSISSSSLVAAAMIEGVRSATVTKLHRQFVGPNRELEAGLLRIGPMEIARVDNDPNHPERGRLLIKMRGGR